MQIVCTLSDEQLPGAKARRKILTTSKAQGDGREIFHDVMPVETLADMQAGREGVLVDEEHMGDIISLVESVQEDYVPPIPMRYKKHEEEPVEPKVVNLDSPTVSVTQVVPPWPKPRDKTNEPPEPDPDPEPTPPPTPPLMPPPEGGEEAEEEAVEEEEDEETMKQKKEERLKREAEEEAARKAAAIPPPLPPPPPSPQPETEVPLQVEPPVRVIEDEIPTHPPVNVNRRVLLTEDAQKRSKLRKLRQKLTTPLTEERSESEAPESKEPVNDLEKPSNFKDLPDLTQIIRGSSSLSEPGDPDTINRLPFGAIMAIVTSYKYSINTWTNGIVDFVVDTAVLLYENKQDKFQLAPVHVIPKIALGHQTYHANVDVFGEGPSWQMENILSRKFFRKYDRGMITTASYSCAIFMRNGLFYLFDGSPCSAMGLRLTDKNDKGKACFLRFRNLHDLVSRINYNKDGRSDNQQFILSRIIVRRLLKEARHKLPEDYDYQTRKPSSQKSKTTIVEDGGEVEEVEKSESVTSVGYQLVDGVYRVEGTTALDVRKTSVDIKSCHFVCLIAMLMATMHPIRTWNNIMVDTCIEKGLEIYEKATNLNICEKRMIKNIIIEGKIININIKRIIVVNENPEKRLEQFLRAVLMRLRYVIIRYPQCSMVICQIDGFYHIFDPYAPSHDDTKDLEKTGKPSKKGSDVASWTMYRSLESVIRRIRKTIPSKDVDNPEFYTFELTSVKSAPRHSAMIYRLSPLFKPDENPNLPYLKRRKIRPLVNEKMYWLNVPAVPWSRMRSENDLGFERKTPKTMWKEWDIEFPGDLYSLWGTIHPLDHKFEKEFRGKQYLAVSVVALGMTQACHLSAWTSGFIDGIVNGGNELHKKCVEKIGNAVNHEVTLSDLDGKFDGMYPFTFTVSFNEIIFGFVYNIYTDRFNLSKALAYFFEKNSIGILTSPTKNLAFGKTGSSYFMFDCQSFGSPLFSPSQGSAYILKCESLNRLVYCITLTLNIKRHGLQFHLYNAKIAVKEQSK